jgi:hypothetical protein
MVAQHFNVLAVRGETAAKLHRCSPALEADLVCWHRKTMKKSTVLRRHCREGVNPDHLNSWIPGRASLRQLARNDR